MIGRGLWVGRRWRHLHPRLRKGPNVGDRRGGGPTDLQGRRRRLAKDFEASIESAVAWILIAYIRRLTRRLARA